MSAVETIGDQHAALLARVELAEETARTGGSAPHTGSRR